MCGANENEVHLPHLQRDPATGAVSEESWRTFFDPVHLAKYIYCMTV
jgi:hypothetical protein